MPEDAASHNPRDENRRRPPFTEASFSAPVYAPTCRDSAGVRLTVTATTSSVLPWRRGVRFSVATGSCCPYGRGLFIAAGACTRPARGGPKERLPLPDVPAAALLVLPGSVYEAGLCSPLSGDEAMALLPLTPLVPWQREILEAAAEIAVSTRRRATGSSLKSLQSFSHLASLLKNKPLKRFVPLRKNEPRGCFVLHRGALRRGYDPFGRRRRRVVFAAECCRIFKKVTGRPFLQPAVLQAFKGHRAAAGGSKSVAKCLRGRFCSQAILLRSLKAVWHDALAVPQKERRQTPQIFTF